MGCVVRKEAVQLKIDTKHQTHQKVHEMLDQILRENGAIECGIMAELSVKFERPAGGD